MKKNTLKILGVSISAFLVALSACSGGGENSQSSGDIDASPALAAAEILTNAGDPFQDIFLVKYDSSGVRQ